MFAAAFPLGPLFAFIFNLLAMRMFINFVDLLMFVFGILFFDTLSPKIKGSLGSIRNSLSMQFWQLWLEV